jgi:hypothetical protein
VPLRATVRLSCVPAVSLVLWLGVNKSAACAEGDPGQESRQAIFVRIVWELVNRSCCVCGGSHGAPDAFEEDSWGNTYHLDCVRGERCHQCYRRCDPRLTGGPGTHLADERWICHDCWQTQITGAAAQRELRAVRSALAAHGIKVSLKNVTLTLVPYTLVATEDAIGTTQSWKVGRGSTRFHKARIKIVDHLAQPLFRSVAAHELMHVWVAQHVGRDIDQCVEEGAAEYMSELILKADKSALAAYLLRAQAADPSYLWGDCYRGAKRHSVHEVLKYVGKNWRW